jgi:predicted phosphodiesterase
MHYLYPNSNFAVFDNAPYKYYFIAHTHRPMYLSYFDKKILNPGSVGQPRDGDDRPSIVCFDLDDDYFEFRRI